MQTIKYILFGVVAVLVPLIVMGASYEADEISNANAIDVTGGKLRIQGTASPSSGAGLELGYVSSVGTITSYDRTGSTYENVKVTGEYIDLYGGTNHACRVGGENFAVYGDLYYYGSLIDSTPFFDGDALAEINKIHGNNGSLDHKTLPAFVKKEAVVVKKQKIERIKVKAKDAYNGGALKAGVKKDDTTGEFYLEETVMVDEEVWPEGRDVGAMVSLLTRAVQQLSDRIEALEAKEQLPKE